jgi:hypothetical protein
MLDSIRIFLDGDTKMIARCREASMGFTGTALSVRENWDWDWSLASRNWPDFVVPLEFLHFLKRRPPEPTRAG